MLCTTILTFTVKRVNMKTPEIILIITAGRHNNKHNQLNISLTYLDIFFQIRAEKPYYMADPEVDSLVSQTYTYV